jgi:hypothetical protein
MEISLETRYFYKFLQRHGCLRKFINNTLESHPERSKWSVMEILSNSNCIGIGFIWAASKEGDEYWSDLNRKWNEERQRRKSSDFFVKNR